MNRQLLENLERSLAGIAVVVHRDFTKKVFISRKGSYSIPIIIDDNATNWKGVEIRADRLSDFTTNNISKMLQAVGDFLDGNEREQARKCYLLPYPGENGQFIVNVDGYDIFGNNDLHEEHITLKLSSSPKRFSKADIEQMKKGLPFLARDIDEWKVEA